MLSYAALMGVCHLSLCASTLEAQGHVDHFQRAANALQRNDKATAVAEYEAGLLDDPEASDARNNLGAIYLEMGKYQKAVDEFETALKQKPANLDYQFNLGFGLFHIDRCQEALPHLTLAGQSATHASDANFIAGLCSYHLGVWQNAVDRIQQSLREGEGTPERLYVLICAARKAKQPGLAMKAFAELASRYPESVFVHELLADAYDLTRDSTAAEREFARAIQVAPQQPELNFDLGYLYWKERRFSEAVRCFQRELVLDSRSASSLYYLGDIFLKQGEARKALDFFRRALHSGGQYPEAWIGIGGADEALHNWPAAEKAFRKTVTYFPDSVEPHYRLAQLLRKENKQAEAEEQFALVTKLQQQDRARAEAILSIKR